MIAIPYFQGWALGGAKVCTKCVSVNSKPIYGLAAYGGMTREHRQKQLHYLHDTAGEKSASLDSHRCIFWFFERKVPSTALREIVCACQLQLVETAHAL